MKSNMLELENPFDDILFYILEHGVQRWNRSLLVNPSACIPWNSMGYRLLSFWTDCCAEKPGVSSFQTVLMSGESNTHEWGQWLENQRIRVLLFVCTLVARYFSHPQALQNMIRNISVTFVNFYPLTFSREM